jgi:subtilisin family serine protease
MDALDLIKIAPLMARTRGSRAVKIGLIDGPVATRHPDLTVENLRELRGGGNSAASCHRPDSLACLHGTFMSGILSARRSSPAPAICPGCILLVRSIFAESTSPGRMPNATPHELAAAIVDCIDAGARLINLSVALSQPSTTGEQSLEAALNYAVRRGVILAAAAGNQGTIGTSSITRHPWVIPVVACDLRSRPMHESNLGSSIGARGLSAPGDRITSLAVDGGTVSLSGTSVAVPFVTGAIALLWSEFPSASAAQIKWATTQGLPRPRRSVVPPLLDASAAHRALAATLTRAGAA